uniref:WD repeat-containing protein WRAP73 n=1 Tax=Tanacetum cinerariifolium TaxID=118510 RepID=A0A6L2LST1_TANCI|nr:hypothetical protein [Tanacetum cinerariifolium]
MAIKEWPKHASNVVSLTKDGSFAAICTKRDCKDYVNLISCHSWEIMGVFAVDTLDLADVEWSPNDSTIVLWDSPLEYKIDLFGIDLPVWVTSYHWKRTYIMSDVGCFRGNYGCFSVDTLDLADVEWSLQL